MKIKIRFLIRRISVLKKAIFNGMPVKIVYGNGYGNVTGRDKKKLMRT
jgi:hypothetical protein